MPHASLASLTCEHWLRTIEVNTVGTTRVTSALLPNLERSHHNRLIVAISSHMGSIGDIDRDGSYYYRSSKAALNAAMQCVAVGLKAQHIGVLFSPWRSGDADGTAGRHLGPGRRHRHAAAHRFVFNRTKRQFPQVRRHGDGVVSEPIRAIPSNHQILPAQSGQSRPSTLATSALHPIYSSSSSHLVPSLSILLQLTQSGRTPSSDSSFL